MGQRDLGQLCTNRAVIRYMIKLCKPVVDGDKMDVIIDPMCGTAKANILNFTIDNRYCFMYHLKLTPLQKK